MRYGPTRLWEIEWVTKKYEYVNESELHKSQGLNIFKFN